MAIDYKVVVVTINNTLGPQSVIGLGFQPKAIIAFGGRRTNVAGKIWVTNTYGVATGPLTAQWAAGNQMVPSDPPKGIGGFKQGVFFLDWHEDLTPATGTFQCSLTTFDVDGFTFQVEKAAAEFRQMYCICLGGSSLSAKALVFNAPIAPGSQALVGAGFQPKATIFGCGTISATPESPVTADLPISLGWGVSSTKQGVSGMFFSDVATPPAGSVTLTDRCIVALLNKTTVGDAASFVSNDLDGATINWVTKQAVATKFGALFLGGNAQFFAGNFVQRSGGGEQVISGLGFKPQGEFFFADGKIAAAAPSPGLGQMMGASSLAQNVVVSIQQPDLNGSATNPKMQFSEAACIKHIDENDAVLAAATVTSHDIDGFKLNWASADSIPRQQIFLAFGDVAQADTGKLKSGNKIKQLSSTIGLGPFSLTSTPTSSQPWSPFLKEKDAAYYCADNYKEDGTLQGEWEIGIGVMLASGELDRRVVLESSNSNQKVDFSPGTKHVFHTLPAQLITSLMNATNLGNTPTAPEEPPPTTGEPTPPPPPPPPPSGIIITAATGNLVDVQAAVNSAQSGSTVQVPSGTFDWGAGTLNMPGGIYLKGAGKAFTRIRRTLGTSGRIFQVKVDGTNGLQARISDIYFEGILGATTAAADYGIGLINGCVDFKIWNCGFTKFSWAAIFVGASDRQRGVIFSNEIINNYSSAIGNLGYGVAIDGNGNYPPSFTLGTAENVFVEDNFFRGNRHDIRGLLASRYVLRHNTLVGVDSVRDFAMVDVHGRTGNGVGGRQYEIYNNTFRSENVVGPHRTAIGLRGGDGVIWGNTIPSGFKYPIELEVEGFACGTYPGPDQIRNLHIWSNTITPNATFGGESQRGDGVVNRCTSSIGFNRDYFMTQKVGYTPFTYPHPLR